ncbi:S4 domain-containing protein YaaA [Mechercharimyces sp. CAU 1602]|uniref:S4 domain-containing protein YaaA n=1 Tax=Mechercharimyces sp. CAU 1602 TaxID=2973933 RepID=UPI0021638514|nr:S4 domain-containing protein YaaA [Mechercharimyces sp. CAU 1602]MCS1352701.1 S4 domain-containing protein YaaA [Mechercharimyces sp. CAU 1602]
MQTVTISISTPYITLGQLLKRADVIASGGEAKPFLAEYAVWINGEQDQRRGRKIVPRDKVEVEEFGVIHVIHNE